MATEQLGHHLHLVFSENGDDPLVVESSWKGRATREAPDLTHVRAKLLLRAVSILLVLAKYRETQTSALNGDLLFQVKNQDFKKGTWICTIANDFQTAVVWIKEHFHVPASELFVWASVGSTHNEGGKKTPLALFNSKKLSLANLHLWVKPAGLSRQEPRLLRPDELLPFALKLEAGHWKKSAIKELHPERQPASRPDDLFLACAAGLSDDPQNGGAADGQAYFDLVFRVLMEKEFDRYRENCRPFFSLVGNSLYTAKLPFLWEGYAWNQRQIELLRDNCTYYAYFSYLSGETLVRHGGQLGDPKFTKSIWREVIRRHNILEPPFIIFGKLAQLANLTEIRCTEDYSEPYHLPLLEYDDSSLLILDEARDSIRRLKWGLENSNRAIVAGTFFVQQVLLIDFLNEVCQPFYAPDSNDLGWAAADLPMTILYLKKEAAQNRQLINRFCANRTDFLEAAQAGRALLLAQTAFWNALHRRLLAVETGRGITG